MKRVLTGITTSGTPHIGNYVGAIRPAIAASRNADTESFYFLADYHALIKTGDPERVQRSTLEIAATWLALGLDPERVYFYRQSDIPEIPELTWLLTCVTAKGLLNRAHAYKAAVDANVAAGEDADAAITAGLYMYPVLMAADILLFNAHAVPVGRDQIQHIEMARDIGQRFNHLYGRDYFTLPEAQIEESTAILPGLDGRKMSKSYDNVIPLWDDAKSMRKKILGIVTNSLLPGQAKDPQTSHLFTIYQAFADADESAAVRRAYAEGIAWGEAKEQLAARIEAELAQARERYMSLIAQPAAIEKTLLEGAARARARIAPFMRELRDAVGLRPLQVASGDNAATRKSKAAAARFIVYRERDGKFHFKLNAADGSLLLQSRAFDGPELARKAQDALLDADPQVLRRDALICTPCGGGFQSTIHVPADHPIADSAVMETDADCRDGFGQIAAVLAGLRADRNA